MALPLAPYPTRLLLKVGPPRQLCLAVKLPCRVAMESMTPFLITLNPAPTLLFAIRRNALCRQVPLSHRLLLRGRPLEGN